MIRNANDADAIELNITHLLCLQNKMLGSRLLKDMHQARLINAFFIFLISFRQQYESR